MNKNGPHRLIYLNALVTRERHYFKEGGVIRRCGLAGGSVTLQVGFEVFKVHAKLTVRLPSLQTRMQFSATTRAPAATMLPDIMIMDYVENTKNFDFFVRTVKIPQLIRCLLFKHELTYEFNAQNP